MDELQIRMLHWLSRHGGTDVAKQDLAKHFYYCTTKEDRDNNLDSLESDGYVSKCRRIAGNRGAVPTFYSLTKKGVNEVKKLRKAGIIA